MTKPNLKSILEAQKIRDLERLIPELERNYSITERRMIAERAFLLNKIQEYKLEYKERVGRDYDAYKKWTTTSNE